ncbi:MAG TPA: ABC transporter substrate-binding protein [Chloroflexota bacterium]|nr:ABC transporter substrate-binding protein [Chloroflexota bacterium]
MAWLRGVFLGLVAGALVACTPAASSGTAVEQPAAPRPPAPAVEAPAAPAEKLVLALPSIAGVFIPHVLAQQKGFFSEEGFDVELPVLRSNLVSAGLASGEADYSGVFGPAVRDVLSGMPFRIVGAVVDKSTRWVMASPSVQSMEQLRGKAIAVSTIGSGPYNSGVLALEHFGIDPYSEVTWLAAGTPAERFLAVSQGAAQASIFSASEVPRAEAMGLSRLLRLDDVVPLPESGVVTTQARLDSQRLQVKRVLRAMVRALQYTKGNREGTLPVFMQFLSITREEAEEAYDASLYAYSDDGTVSERTLRYAIAAEQQQLKRTDDVPASSIADFGPLYEVLGELGITPAAGSAR